MLLYIHIPFCDSKCHYCAFNSYTNLHKLKKEYMNALNIHLKSELKATNKEIKTLFIGGGTPSCIDAFLYEDIFKTVKPYLKQNAEITTEANPNSATKEWLNSMFDYGVNRVSFGVQSLNDEKLKFLGRNHNKKDVLTAVLNAKEIGFKKVNCDLIYGVKDDSFQKIKDDIDILKSLKIDHISAYSLTIEEGTKFFSNKKVKIDDEVLSSQIFEYLEINGFIQYEISNFATTENSRSLHNIGYWKHNEYLGIGAGAVGYKNGSRFYCKKDIKEYIANPLKFEIENLTPQDIKVEKVLLGFRCFLGVDLNLFNKNELKKIDDLISNKKLFIDAQKVYTTNFLLADEIALYILD